MTLWGPDVSRFQPNVDWAKVKQAGASFAFIKATEGASGTSPGWREWGYPAKARAQGLYVGSYHFGRPEQSTPEQQANFHCSMLAGHLGSGYFPPVLDIEESGGLGSAALCAWVDRWCKRARAVTGRPVIVYTYSSFFKNNLASGAGWLRPGVLLWIAHYTSAPRPAVSGWTLWQYTSSGSIPGIAGRCDISRYAGTPQQLAALAGVIQPVPQPSPTTIHWNPTTDLTKLGPTVPARNWQDYHPGQIWRFQGGQDAMRTPADQLQKVYSGDGAHSNKGQLVELLADLMRAVQQNRTGVTTLARVTEMTPELWAALMDWKAKHNITAWTSADHTGEVGPSTWASLLGQTPKR